MTKHCFVDIREGSVSTQQASKFSNAFQLQVPSFNPPEASVSFSEEAVVGTRRLLEPASIDAPGQIVSYEIVGDSSESPFRIHETRYYRSYLIKAYLEILEREYYNPYVYG